MAHINIVSKVLTQERFAFVVEKVQDNGDIIYEKKISILFLQTKTTSFNVTNPYLNTNL